MEYEVCVEVVGTVRVKADSEDDAMDMAAAYAEIGVLERVHRVRLIEATEV